MGPHHSAPTTADEKRREALALAASIELTEEDISELEHLRRDLDKAAAQLDVASVRITFEPDGNRAVKVDGVEHEAPTPLRLSHDAMLHLEGFGALLVRPGGGVEDLARKVEAAQRALDQRLQQFGFGEVSDAVVALRRKRHAEQDAVTYKKLMTAHAPKGLDARRDQVERQRIAAAPSAEPPIEASEEILTRDRQELRTVEGEVEANEAATEQARTIREQGGRAQAARDARLTAAKRDHEARLHELADGRSYRSRRLPLRTMAINLRENRSQTSRAR